MIFVTFLFFFDYFFKVFALQWLGIENTRNLYSIFGVKYIPKTISAIPQWDNLGNWYLHNYANCDTFPVVMGSFWYLKVYYIVTLFGTIILKFFPKHINHLIVLCLGLICLFQFSPEY